MIELLVSALGREVPESAERAALMGGGDTPGIIQGNAAVVINPQAP